MNGQAEFIPPVPVEIVPPESKLSDAEEKELARLEAVVRKHIHGFVEAGGALWEINRKRLYRAKGHFADYCRNVFHLSPSWGYRLMQAWEIRANLTEQLESRNAAPASVACTHRDGTPANIVQTDSLSANARLELSEAPKEMQLQILDSVSAENGGRVTAPAIARHIARAKHRARPKLGNRDSKPAKKQAAKPSPP